MEQLWFTALLNRLFGGPVLSLLLLWDIHPKHPTTPISNSFRHGIGRDAVLVTFFLAVRLRAYPWISPADCSTPWRASKALLATWARKSSATTTIPTSPYLVALGLFHSHQQPDRLIPGFESPTACPDRPPGLRLADLVLLPCPGIRAQWLGYFKHFHRARSGGWRR